MSEGTSDFSWRESFVASGIVACTFFYFLLFAQFALLHRIEILDAEKEWLQPVMLIMGGGGLLGSGIAWRYFSPSSLAFLLRATLSACAILAFVAARVERIEYYLAIGFGVGVASGILTVVVVPSLRLLSGRLRIGRVAGLGTGLAYFASNVPWLFQQEAAAQCLVAGGAGVLGLFITAFLPSRWDTHSLEFGDRDRLFRFSLKWLVVFFFALVWLDSAAFYAIQETDEMRDATWGTPSHLWGNGLVHLFFGVASGWALDKGRLPLVLAAAMAFLVGGCLWLKFGYGSLSWFGAGLYVAGVSLYSTGLVAVVAQRGNGPGMWSMAPAAALLLGVAGWIGSGMGVGMARDLGTVPYAFLAVAVVVAMIALLGLASCKREVAE